jgi:NADH dehydrogenase [ubiquinone] 1 alpha subcomplex assembly factor 1
MDINPTRPPLTLYSFTSSQPPLAKLEDFALGSDSDIGGTSRCQLEPDAAQRFVAFKGHLSTDVQPEYATRVRGGYVAFRNKSLTSLFGELSWDLSLYSHLRVTVGEYKGDERWRSRWFCNLQTDGPVR